MKTRQADEVDCALLSSILRQADLDEIAAASGERPLVALCKGLWASEFCHAITEDDENHPLAIFGIVRVESNPTIGLVWMLGSDLIKMHSIEFLRKSKEWVEAQDYEILYNNIDARNTVHIKWLQWLGFTFIQELPNYGVEQRLFYQFVRIKTHV